MTSTQHPNLYPMIEETQALRDTFRTDVLEGLALEQKAIPAKHLYDARGSELFDRIVDVEDYYPTRTERAIAERYAEAISDAIGPDAVVIEPGAGSGEKAESLLEVLETPRAFVPIEISRDALEPAAERIAHRFPDIEVHPIRGDFTRDVPPSAISDDRRLVYFPGSTIGNLDRPQRLHLFECFAHQAGPEGRLLIGFDLVKDVDVLRRAYDDREGVTAAFNLNLLERINRELDADFDQQAFSHSAPWNEAESRIEMHLVSETPQSVSVQGHRFDFRQGETIHTENSHKFTIERFCDEVATGGFELIDRWTDDQAWYCLALYRVAR